MDELSLTPQYTMTLDQNIFTNCSKALFVVATENMTITRNTIEVKETGAGYDYGSYIYNCGGFEFEENTFSGTGSNTPKVGSIFQDCGPANNEFYKNNYNGFVGDTALSFSAGTIISGQNRDLVTGQGLEFGCNNYSSTSDNNHDMAFTDLDVSIADNIGMMSAPVGNTFDNTFDCVIDPGKHFYVQDDSLNMFTYFHHDPNGIVEQVVPECFDSPIESTWFSNTNIGYDSGSCPSELSQFQPDEELEIEILEAESELAVLENVYGDWTDGGDTEGLLEFIQTPSNDSYAVRNELMLVAPKVSYDAWAGAFDRFPFPAMNPWHLAQALMANSPLEKKVIKLMETSELDPFYQQLVKGYQNGGISMHTLYKSEIAHFTGKQSIALRDLTSKAIRNGEITELQNARDWHEQHPVKGSAQNILGLSLALGDLQKARQVVDVELATSRETEYWEVQDLYLDLAENAEGLGDVDANGLALLRSIAASNKYGSGHAQAWLYLFGQTFPENVVLPFRGPKRLEQDQSSSNLSISSFINVLPNPSSGPVAIAISLPEGAVSGSVRVYDPLGRIVHERRFSGRMQLLELDTKRFTTGIYIAELIADGVPLGATKFEIIK